MRVVSEASSTDVQAVLSDQTVRVLADAAVGGGTKTKEIRRQKRFEGGDEIQIRDDSM